jgi:hypothetical protein
LAAGGALLTFPAGEIEPDPALLPGAHASLARWPDAVAVFLRIGRGTPFVPAVVSGVLSATALRHPFTRLRRRAADRHWLAALLQLLRPDRHPIAVEVRMGAPVEAAADAPEAVRDALLAAVERLLAEAGPAQLP